MPKGDASSSVPIAPSAAELALTVLLSTASRHVRFYQEGQLAYELLERNWAWLDQQARRLGYHLQLIDPSHPTQTGVRICRVTTKIT